VKRVLILAYFYPPLAGGGVHRVLSFTRHLPGHGWACTVVCAGERDYWVHDRSLLESVPRETEIIRVEGGSALSAWLRLRGGEGQGRRSGRTFAPLRALSDWWLLPDSYAGWARRAREAAAARVAAGECGAASRVDVVLSSSPPDSVHLAARFLARDTGLPWIADFRDPWIGLAFRRPPTPWHAARQAAMESSVLDSASLVLAASRTHADALAARERARPRDLLHLPNGFEPAPRVAIPRDADHFRVAFTGTLSLVDDVGTLLDAVHRLLAREPAARSTLRVELAGPYDEDWRARAHALGLDGVVSFLGSRPHAETRALQRAADLLLLWRPRGEGYRTMVPGKLYEYLDSGRPIVALLPAGDEAAELVKRAGGAVLPPASPDTLERDLAARLSRWRAGERVADAVPGWLGEHTRGHLAGTLARALDAVAAQGRP